MEGENNIKEEDDGRKEGGDSKEKLESVNEEREEGVDENEKVEIMSISIPERYKVVQEVKGRNGGDKEDNVAADYFSRPAQIDEKLSREEKFLAAPMRGNKCGPQGNIREIISNLLQFHLPTTTHGQRNNLFQFSVCFETFPPRKQMTSEMQGR